MGLQYLVDRPELSRDRGRVFDEIADGTITIEKIESSDFYNKIEQRVHFLPLLEQMIDSNDTVFKYNKNRNAGRQTKSRSSGFASARSGRSLRKQSWSTNTMRGKQLTPMPNN